MLRGIGFVVGVVMAALFLIIGGGWFLTQSGAGYSRDRLAVSPAPTSAQNGPSEAVVAEIVPKGSEPAVLTPPKSETESPAVTSGEETPMDADLSDPPPEPTVTPSPRVVLPGVKLKPHSPAVPAPRLVQPADDAPPETHDTAIVVSRAVRWEPFWQFNSKTAAENFAAHLRKTTGLNLAVFPRGRVFSVVAYSYADETERLASKQRIEERAGIKLNFVPPLTVALEDGAAHP